MAGLYLTPASLILSAAWLCVPTQAQVNEGIIVTNASNLVPCPGLVSEDENSVVNQLKSGLFALSATSCVCSEARTYTVDPGFYMLNETSPPVQCPEGSYCPGNMTQPTFCCPGYVCNKNTKSIDPCGYGYYCPAQSIQKIDCGPLAVCPERTDKIERWGTILFIFCLIVVLAALYWLLTKFIELRSKKFRDTLGEVAARGDVFEEKSVKSPKSTKKQDIEMMSSKAKHDSETTGSFKGVHSIVKQDSRLEDESKRASVVEVKTSAPLATADKKIKMKPEMRMNIEFDSLEYTLPSGITIMSGVSGVLKEGRLCAVMGPSGAGKTTLFNLITGKAKRTGGIIKINGKEDKVSRYKRLVGFVPQDDVMIRTLTVTDILSFSAHRRLPKSMTMQEKDEVVAGVVNTLDINHIVDSVIGDERIRGISGGQRKRVNIGMELVANPSLLFLDEPTTGLDSATSKDLAHTLKMLCKRTKLTAAAIIHSPSPPTFNEFDDLCLLGKGGRMIYFGPLDKARTYFCQTLGFAMPHLANPADHYLNIALGKVESPKLPNMHWSGLFDLWHAHEDAVKKTGDDSKGYRADMQSAIDKVNQSTNERQKSKAVILHQQKENPEEEKGCCGRCCDAFKLKSYRLYKSVVYDTYMYWCGKEGVCTELYKWLALIFCCGAFSPEPSRRIPNTVVIFWLCLKRAIKQGYADPWQFCGEMVLPIGMGLFLAVAVYQMSFVGSVEPLVCEVLSPAGLIGVCASPISDGLTGTGNFMTFGIGFAGIAMGSTTFGAERVVWFRHASTGLDAIPYFTAKMIADIPKVFCAGTLTASLVTHTH